MFFLFKYKWSNGVWKSLSSEASGFKKKVTLKRNIDNKKIIENRFILYTFYIIYTAITKGANR